MRRLFDEAELKEWVENWFYQHKYYHPYSKSNNIPCNELYDILERMPTIDAVEVVHGEWEERYIEDANPLFRRRFYCSMCGEWTTYGKTRYCPNCGAKMDGKEQNDED